MEVWLFIIVTVCTAALIKFIIPAGAKARLPPGPLTLPFIGTLMLFQISFAEVEPIIRGLNRKFGPIVALHLGPRAVLFISSRCLAHQALIQNGAVFADRPPAIPTLKIESANQHTVSSAHYLMAEILHPSRVRTYDQARRWVLEILLDRFKSERGTAIEVMEHFQYAMFSLLVVMCFGDGVGEEKIREIEKVQRAMLVTVERLNVMNLLPPWLGKIVFRRQWEQFHHLRRNQAAVLLPLIKARRYQLMQNGEAKEVKVHMSKRDNIEDVICYLDTLLNLKLPNEKRSLTEEEILSLCSEFLTAGTDTTSATLQWIMANLVKYPHIQTRIYKELTSKSSIFLKEDDLHKLTYLKAVVLESLRRHPPTHFVIPHAVTKDTELGGYIVPKNGWVTFTVAEMGLDPTVWEDPMEFNPDRFLNSRADGIDEGFDITGTREIKMMPFGVGRRMCPAYNLALLHLEFFVANLVWAFEWRPAEGDTVDLSEKQHFTTVMKIPLKVIVTPRVKA